MELSVQNSNFLSFLNRLDIDVKQFPEKTFDGLFENVSELNNYFFHWFVENITPDNALTQSEQAAYFQLANSQSLCSEDEVNHVLSSCSPTFEEVMSLDVNYVNNYLSEDLDSLKKNFTELSTISSKIDRSYDEVKKKQNNLKETISARKKYLNIVKRDYADVSSAFLSKVEEVKLFLLEEPCLRVDFDLFYDSLPKEENILDEFESSKMLTNEILNSSSVDLFNMLEEDLQCVEISTTLSEGFLRMKKVKIDFLTKLLQNKSQRSFTNFSLTKSELDEDVTKEVKVLESELFEKWKILSHCEVQKISDEYLYNKLDINKSYLNELVNYKNFVKLNLSMNLCLLHILIRSIDCLELTTDLRKQLYKNLIEYKAVFSRDVTNFELRKERFKEMIAHQNQHPLLSAVKKVMNFEENLEDDKLSLKKVTEIMLNASDDSSFISYEFRNNLQSAIKSLFHKTLCGPTNQLLFVPVELLIKQQDCEHWESRLSEVIKQVVNKYVSAKVTVSKSDRKILLLWIDFLTNPLAFLTKGNETLQSKTGENFT